MNDYTLSIQKTASTLFDLSDHSEVAYSRQIADLMIKKTGIEWSRVLVNDFSAFPVSRFHTNQNLLDFLSNKLGPKLQIVELGAGFTPHYLNLKNRVSKYIEVDHEDNSKLKKEIVGEIVPTTPDLVYVSGDILDIKTWENIKANLDLTNPVVIFSEGVIAQYFDVEQKKAVFNFINDLLVVDGSTFILDDTLRNHPEVHSNPIIAEGMKRVVQKSGSSVYKDEFQTFEKELNRWKEFFPNKKVVTVEYIMSKPEMDFVISTFKLIVCLEDTQGNLEPEIIKMSKLNKFNRIWK